MIKELKAIEKELRIFKHQIDQYQDGILVACYINLKRDFEKIESWYNKKVGNNVR